MSTFLVFVIPALISVVLFKVLFKKEITMREFGIHTLASLAITALVYGVSYLFLYSKTADTEILNGFVTDKYRDTIICTEYSSCKNYYYKTEYYYAYSNGKLKKRSRQVKVFLYPTEFDWIVKTSLGDSHEIERIDDRGVYPPPKFIAVNKGDYAASTNIYQNPLLITEVSLFNSSSNQNLFTEKELEEVPNYPKIFEQYKFNPVLNATKFNTKEISDLVRDRMRELGKKKELNTVFVLYNPATAPAQYKEKIMEKWHGGKKNDVILFMGVDNTGIITEFSSVSYANNMGNEFLHSTLSMFMAGSTESLNTTTIDSIMNIISDEFKRMPASEFEYLIRDVKPSPFLSILIVLIVCVLGVFFVKNDETN